MQDYLTIGRQCESGMWMETKKRIMDSAFRLFAEKGNEFSLAEVAKEVGIQKPSIYAHFPSKDVLMHAVTDREIEEYFFEIHEQSRDLKHIFFMILGYYSNSTTRLFFWKRLLLFPPESFDTILMEKIHNLSQTRFEIIREILDSCVDTGLIRPQDTTTAAYSFLALIHGLLSTSIIYKSEDVSTHYEEIWQIFWNGII